MSTMLIRIYDTATAAASAVNNLRSEGFQFVSHFKGDRGRSAANSEARKNLVAEMAAAHILRGHAEVYADHVNDGRSLVVCHAPFSSALRAGATMDRHSPAYEGIPTSTDRSAFDFTPWNEATPASSALQMPVLSSVEHPVETLTGISSLTEGTAFLSDALGIPILKEGVAHKTTSFGLPLLKRSKGPVVSLKTLIDNPTPLSSLFRLSVLSREVA